MAAYHDVNPAYYLGLGTTQGQAITGGPDDHKAGWVVGAGFKLNTPWLLNWFGSGAGDYIQTQFNYTQGALKYLNQTTNSNWGINDGSQASCGSWPMASMAASWRVRPLAGTLADWRRTDHSMERQRGLRALLEPALADVTLRRLHESGVRRRSRLTSVHRHHARTWHTYRGNASVHQFRLLYGLADLVGWFADAVEHHQGLLHGSRRDVLQDATAPTSEPERSALAAPRR